MKHRLLFLAILFLTLSSVTAQNYTATSSDLSNTFFIPPDSLYLERVVYEVFNMRYPPVYPGGEKEMLKYLASNIQFPVGSKENEVASEVMVTFIVEPDGTVSNVRVVRNDGEFGQSVLQAIQRMPRWSPGIKDGEAVAFRFWLPVRNSLR